jgi:hypothetical protein
MREFIPPNNLQAGERLTYERDSVSKSMREFIPPNNLQAGESAIDSVADGLIPLFWFDL